MLDIAVIGGGAAGFFAAIAAKEKYKDATVTILEKSTKVLTKVEITGGGRCNLTNSFSEIKDLRQAYPRGYKLMKRLFKVFDNEDTYRWFTAHGVPLTIQEDECIFPQSQNAHSVVACLMQTARRLGVNILTNYRVSTLKPLLNGDIRLLFTTQETRVFNRVIVATGGSPRIEGLKYLADIGHEIVSPVPSLFTFNIADKPLKELMGTVVESVTATIPGTKLRADGALLITHWGVSGPAILKLSSYAARYIAEQGYQFSLSVNWIGESNATLIEQQLHQLIISNSRKQVSSIHPYCLSTRMWQYLLNRTVVEHDKKWGELSKKALHKLIETLTSDTYTVTGKGAFRDEFVTCGGVSLASINPHTLESKTCPHLHFAGEVLDIDAITGGFNLQAAWTTGYVAGTNL